VNTFYSRVEDLNCAYASKLSSVPDAGPLLDPNPRASIPSPSGPRGFRRTLEVVCTGEFFSDEGVLSAKMRSRASLYFFSRSLKLSPEVEGDRDEAGLALLEGRLSIVTAGFQAACGGVCDELEETSREGIGLWVLAVSHILLWSSSPLERPSMLDVPTSRSSNPESESESSSHESGTGTVAR